jgi:hypothetical protein
MSRLNKSLLKKAKLKLREQRKSEDADIAERAENVLSRRKNRKAERRETVRESEYEKPVTKVGWNFSTGELVQIKRRNRPYYNVDDSCYLVIGVRDQSWGNREETNSHLEITGPAGIIVIRASHLKKVL